MKSQRPNLKSSTFKLYIPSAIWTFKLGHAAKKLIQTMKNSAECTSKDESDEIKNEYSLRKRLHMSIRRRLYIRRRGVSLSRGIRFSRRIYGERLLCLLVAREVEVEI